MAYTTYDRYLETEVLSADPIQLVNMLYRGALEAVSTARIHLAARAIAERSGRIMKAWDILHELSTSLDRAQAPELSSRLAELYAHMQQRLIDANVQQADAPLAEVETLLITLSEAWQTVQTSAPRAREAEYQPVSCAF
jgi:flagellar protein FliS